MYNAEQVYCDNDPVNYEDADGEFLHLLAPFAVGAVSHFVFHFAGSVVSQLMDGNGVNWRQALGEGVNGGITGGIRMAAVSSGAGLTLMAGLDFVAGTLGDAAERWITDGEFNPRKSITSGLANAAGGRIYGNDPLKSAGSAFLRGFGSGAATSGINYISEFLGGMGQTGAGAYPGMPGMAGALVSGALSPYTNGRDPRSGCGSSGLPGQGLGYSAARGYQYSTGQGESLQGRKRNFDFGDFFQGMLTEGVTEGLSNAGSFGLGKVFDAVKRGIQGRKNRVPGGSRGGIRGRLIPGTEGVVTGGDSTKLGKNMMESMGLPRGTNWTGYQAQHIIPAEMANHPVLQRIGMDLDDASNGLFLRIPADDISTMSRHRGYHSTYNEFVKAKLDAMDINQNVNVLQKLMYNLQQNLKYLQRSGLPLYPSQGATVDLWQRSFERIK